MFKVNDQSRFLTVVDMWWLWVLYDVIFFSTLWESLLLYLRFETMGISFLLKAKYLISQHLL